MKEVSPTKSWNRIGWLLAPAIVLLGFATTPAQAHHAMGGRLPANVLAGFLSGLAHPIIGLDHFAFVVAIGLMAAGFAYRAIVPIGFVLAAMLGTGLHLLKLDLPLVEVAVSLSVVGLGALLVWGRSPSLPLLVGLTTLAGVFHGYAYGESIVGAEPTQIVAYLIGFSVIQMVIALGAMQVGRALQPSNRVVSSLRYTGLGITAIGLGFLWSAVLS